MYQSISVEKGGFIVPGADGGYIFQPMPSHLITSEGPCHIQFTPPADLPEGAIYVHTHPYKNGEEQNHCTPGETLIYENVVGDSDPASLGSMGITRGLIIDADMILSYTPNPSQAPITHNRCGY